MSRVLFGTICLLTVMAQPVRHVIDVAAMQAERRAKPESANSIPLRQITPPVNDAPVIPPPLAVHVLANNVSAFTVGDAFEYRVLVTNVGTDELMFPRSMAAEAFDATMTQARVVGIALSFVDDLLGRQSVGMALLYGAKDVSGSLIPLKHGDEVEIRVPAVWSLTSVPRTYAPSWTRDLHVEVFLQFSPVVGPSLGIFSDNRWDVSLRR